jgi:hypothetical protein
MTIEGEHTPAEAALGKTALDQLVFDNAVSLYEIPVHFGAITRSPM